MTFLQPKECAIGLYRPHVARAPVHIDTHNKDEPRTAVSLVQGHDAIVYKSIYQASYCRSCVSRLFEQKHKSCKNQAHTLGGGDGRSDMTRSK